MHHLTQPALTAQVALAQVQQCLPRGFQGTVLQEHPAWSEVKHCTHFFRFRLLHPPQDLGPLRGDQARIGVVGHQYQRAWTRAWDDLRSPFGEGLTQRFPPGGGMDVQPVNAGHGAP